MAIAKEGDLVRFNCYIRKEQKDAIDKISEESGDSASSVVRMMIESLLNRNSDGK